MFENERGEEAYKETDQNGGQTQVQKFEKHHENIGALESLGTLLGVDEIRDRAE